MEQQPPHHSFLHYGHGHQPAWMAGYHGMVPLGAAPWGNRSLTGTPVTASQSPSLSVGYSATPDEELTYRRVNSVASFASPTGRMSSPLWGHSDNAAAMAGGFPPRHFVESPSPLMMGGVASPEFHGERASQWSALPSPSAAHSHHGIAVGAVSLDDADHEPQFEECEDLPSARSTPPRPTSTASRHSDGSDEIYVGAFVEDAMDAETDSGDEVVGITDDGNLIYRRKKKSKTVVAPQAAIAAPVAVPAAAAIATPEPIAAEVAVEEDDVESDDEVVGITDDGELIYRRAVKPAPAVSETATEPQPQYQPSRGSTPVDVIMPQHHHEVPSHDDSMHGMRFSAPRPFAVSPEQQPAVDPLVAKLLLLKLRDRNRENDPGAHYQQRELRTVEHQLAAVGRERRQQVAAAIDVSALPR